MDDALRSRLDVAVELARRAGALLLEVRAAGFRVEHKPGGEGPVTEADRRANALLVESLRRAFPGDGIVAEETEDRSDAARYRNCWFVDPLDGTREFVKGLDEFAVHVGLAVEGEARLGVVHLPAAGRTYAGVVGGEAWVEDAAGRRPLAVAAQPEPARWRVLVSRSYRMPGTEPVLAALGPAAVLAVGSVGVKCALLAEGAADLYVHVSPNSSRWDACAPEALLRAAGGRFTDLGGAAYRYDGGEIRNARGILAGSAAAHDRALPTVERHAREAGLLASGDLSI